MNEKRIANSVDNDPEDDSVELKFKHVRVARQEEEYQSDLLERQSSVEKVSFFGQEVLSTLSFLQHLKSQSGADLFAKQEIHLRKSLDEVRGTLEGLAGTRVALDFIKSAFASDEGDLRESIQKHSPFFSNIKPSKEDKLVARVHGWEKADAKKIFLQRALARHPEKISDTTFFELLSAHAKNVRVRRSELERALPALQSKFLLQWDKNGFHEKSGLDTLSVGQRLAQIRVVLMDELVSTLEENLGYYDGWSEVIGLSVSLSQEELFRVFTHEVLHALSGQAVLRKQLIFEDDESMVTNESQRVGVRFKPYEESGKSRFRFLNEAITEDLTISLVAQGESNVYAKERELYKFLRESGRQVIGRDVFESAYFENYSVERAPNETGVPAWKKLMRKITEAYGPRFLQRLDDLVQKEGVEVAIARMKENLSGI